MMWCDQLMTCATLSDFGGKLAGALGEAVSNDEIRPPSRLKIFSAGVRVYEGWRTEGISRFLDECVESEGELWFGRVERLDSTGRRLILAYAKKGDGKRAYRRRHREKLNSDSNDRMKQWRESLKPEWRAYCDAYMERFPGSKPYGFGRWLKFGRVSWLKYGALGLTFVEPSSLRHLIKKDYVARSSGRTA